MTGLLSVAVTGTFNSFTSGAVIKSSEVNTNFATLKTAVEGITSSQWTTSGANIGYTAGNVGIGTTSPNASAKVHVKGISATDQSYIWTTNFSESVIGTLVATRNTLDVWLPADSVVLSASGGANPSLIFGTANAERMRISSAGLVGIGRTSTTHPLEVQGKAGLTSGTAWTNISDERLKKVNGLINNSLEMLQKLKPIRYEYNEKSGKLFNNADGKIKYGFTAQNVKSVFPEMVSTDEKGYLWYNPTGFEAILTSAVQELSVRLRSLSDLHDASASEKLSTDKRVLSLEKENTKLREEIATLRQSVETHGRASLRLEERLRAVENTHLVRK